MIGDRINTDIAGAKAIGIQTALVMTGVETEDSLQASDVKPDRVFAGLPELVAALQSAQA
jgi:ribonucleotide monophosphatase NagD (HAD superfamily)